MTTKYKVGDKVRVRSWEAMKREFGSVVPVEIVTPGFSFNSNMNMKAYCGSVVTIKSIENDYYLVEETIWCWQDWMFEGYAFEYGDEIMCSDDNEKLPVKRVYLGYADGSYAPYITAAVENFDISNHKLLACLYKYAKPLPKEPTIKIDIQINGEPAKISDISEEIWNRIRNNI